MISTSITIKEDELIRYILDNFHEDGLLEISYNRVFIPGKILSIDYDDELIITVKLQGQLLNQTVNININNILEEVVELRYTYDDHETILTVI